MTSVLITGIGGSIGIDVARSLRVDRKLRLIGADTSVWGRKIGERLCDTVVSLPRADQNSESYLDALDDALEAVKADFVFVNPDAELVAIAARNRPPSQASPVPDPSVLAICLDKMATVSKAGIADLFPETFLLSNAGDVRSAFAQTSPPFWLRPTIGAGGRGSIVVDTPEEALAWMNYWNARRQQYRWVLQEYLPGRNLNWTGLYCEGTLVATAAMERLSYFLGDVTVSGVSGQVSSCKTVDPRDLHDIADRVVRTLTDRPHGFFSVDMRGDESGRPRVTEINPRLAGRPWLFTHAGVNFPLAALRVLSGKQIGGALAASGFTLNLHLHRQLDVEPVIGLADEAEA